MFESYREFWAFFLNLVLAVVVMVLVVSLLFCGVNLLTSCTCSIPIKHNDGIPTPLEEKLKADTQSNLTMPE
jgi:hypothetical protein